jgi:hypothetical protein
MIWKVFKQFGLWILAIVLFLVGVMATDIYALSGATILFIFITLWAVLGVGPYMENNGKHNK